MYPPRCFAPRAVLFTALSVSVCAVPQLASADAALIWLAAGARNAPCASHESCAIEGGLACLGGTCRDAGTEATACRPSGHPLDAACDDGLACDGLECVPAGGAGELCAACTGQGSERVLCLMDRCDAGLGCDQTSFTCEPAGQRNQPCRERELDLLRQQTLPHCDGDLECVMGSCVATSDEGQPCSETGACGSGLFCIPDGSARGVCSAQPRGLVAERDSNTATSCVRDVPLLFRQLGNWGESYADTFSFDAREGDRLPPENAHIAEYDLDVYNDDPFQLEADIDHVQGIIQLEPGKYLHTRANNDQYAAGLVVSDRSRSRFFYPMNRAPFVSHHPGGLSSFGSSIAVAVEHGVSEVLNCGGNALEGGDVVCSDTRVDEDLGWIDFWEYDRANVENPLRYTGQFSTMLLDGNGRRPSSVAMTRTPDGKRLLFVLGGRSEEGWLLLENRYGSFTQLAHFDALSSDRSTGPYWKMYQNIHFVTSCSGQLYLIGSAGNNKRLPRNRENYVDLWSLGAARRGAFELQYHASFQPMYDHERCELRYAGNPVIEDGFLKYMCSTGTTSISGSDNIGVAELKPRAWTRDPRAPVAGSQCCLWNVGRTECMEWQPPGHACR